MVASRSILAKRLLPVGAVFLVVARITCAQQSQIIIGPNIQVSKTRADRAHTEVIISADPRDPNHLLGCSIIGSEEPFKASTIAYASFDGGRSWIPTLETNEFFMSTDPACTIGPDGTAYFMADVRTAPDVRLTKVYRSNDGGKTWLPPVSVTFVERPSIAVDGTGGKFHGWVYINGWGGVNDIDGKKTATGVSVSRSLNGGRTFEGPTIRAPLEYDQHYVNAMGNCVVLSNGTLACVFSQSNDDAPVAAQVQSVRLDSSLKVITSSNGGQSLSDAVTITSYYMLRRPPGTTNIIPSIEVDRGSGPFKDRLYVVWPDVSSGRVEVSFAYSLDQGNTWSKPKVINDDQPFEVTDPSQGPDDFMPAIAVNREGVVAVMWYDRRENPDNLGWHVRFRASLDGGETFLPSVRVSEAPAAFGRNERWPVFYWRPVAGGGSPSGAGGLLKLDLGVTGQILNGGDYAGMAADAAGIFHPFWVDNRTGLHQVWTATVKVNGGV